MTIKEVIGRNTASGGWTEPLLDKETYKKRYNYEYVFYQLLTVFFFYLLLPVFYAVSLALGNPFQFYLQMDNYWTAGKLFIIYFVVWILYENLRHSISNKQTVRAIIEGMFIFLAIVLGMYLYIQNFILLSQVEN